MPTKISNIRGDITQMKVDVIVNAANETLLGGGGVDGAVHFAAGSELREECGKLGGCKKGEAKITKGYALPVKNIIHTVGPVYGHENGEEAILLKNCYYNSLELARQNSLRSIAFPSISTGCFRFPKDEAAAIALQTTREFILKYPDVFDEIIFVSFSDLDLQVYQSVRDTGRFIF